MMIPSATKFSGDKIVPQSDLREGTASDRIRRKKKRELTVIRAMKRMACNNSRWKAAN